MRAKLINEGEISDLLKPKSKEEINLMFKNIEEKLVSINVREKSIKYLTEIIIAYKGKINFTEIENEIKNDLINYISDSQFNDAMIYILHDNLNI